MYSFGIYAIIIIIISIIFSTKFCKTEYHSLISAEKRKHVNALVRQMYRWYIAATQDQNAIIKILHANYAVGYFSALHDVASGAEIDEITGLDIKKVGEAIIKQQDESIIKIGKQCPKIIPKDEIYLDYVKKFLPMVLKS